MDREKAMRKALRAKMTRKWNAFQAVLASEGEDKLTEMTVIVDQLEIAWNELSSVQETLLEQCTIDDLETEMEESERYQDYLTTARTRLKVVQQEDSLSYDSASATSVRARLRPSRNTNARLPKLTLPSFHGDYTKWSEFWEIFDCNIHNNDAISDVEKFSYLRGLVKGNAQRVIEGLSMTAANYTEAVDLLKKRFGSKNRILKAHVREMLLIEPIKSTKNGALRTLVDKILVHVRALNSLGLDPETYGAFLMQIILSRLPSQLKTEWARKDVNDDLEIEAMMQFLDHEAAALEVTEDEVPKQNHSGPKTLCTATHKNGAQRGAPLSGSCSCCTKTHMLHECPDFKGYTLDQKYEFLKAKRLCFICFRSGHGSPMCKSKYSCRKCQKRHNTLLHRDGNTSSGGPAQVTHTRQDKNNVSLPTIVLKCEVNDVPVVALLDSGSQITLIEKHVAQSLDCKVVGAGGDLHISGIRSHSFVVKNPRRVELLIESNVKIVATEIEYIGVNVRFDDTDKLIPVQVIIGADMLGRVLTGSMKKPDDNTVCFETVVGWSRMGVTDQVNLCSSLSAINDIHIFGEELEALLKCTWEMESPVMAQPEAKKDDTLAVKMFADTVKRDDSGRYLVQWPMKDGVTTLRSCKQQAYARFQQLRRRLSSDPSLLRECQVIMSEYLRTGVVEVVPPGEIETASHPVRYLPYQPVVKWDQSKTKIRLVFDASARDEDGVALNDLMYGGPNLNPEVCEILIRFRSGKIAVTSDIEKAFLQLCLDESQRDLTRFFWTSETGDTVVICRFRRVLFGAKASPFLLAATLRHHFDSLRREYPNTVALIEKGFYVDDLVVSVDTIEEADRVEADAVEILSRMGANLRGWISNSSQKSDCDETFRKDVLGIHWRVRADTIVVAPPESLDVTSLSKRSLLRFLAKIWDPLGLLTPLTISGKVIIREIWKLSCDWDSPLPVELEALLNSFSRCLAQFPPCEVPRCLKISAASGVQLHAFGDASSVALGAVVYARVTQPSGDVDVSFVIAKAKLTPSKQTSIPRLELLAALLAARLARSLHCKSEIFCWTDSRVALAWISGNVQQWKQFVSNRVQAIHELTPPSAWHFVQGENNPADILSRGVLQHPTFEPGVLLEGPSFLSAPVVAPPPESGAAEDDVQVSAEAKKILCTLALTARDPLVDLNDYSTLTRLLRVTGWIMRFVTSCKNKVARKHGRNVDPLPPHLTSAEISTAETYWVKHVQQVHFSAELRDKDVTKHSELASLRPFQDDDGVLRSDRRLGSSGMTHDEKFPIIVPRTSQFARLIILDAHLRLCHASVTATLCHLRNRFWVTKARSTVKSIVHRCVVCRRDHVRCTVEDVPPLPFERVTDVDPKPFRHVGIDFTGPISHEKGSGKKLYILLITCTRIRAVHLELVDSMDRASCYCALKCFFFRRGVPTTIISDNAKTFKALAPIVASDYRVDWQFITPYAPWRGGFYERLNKSVKEPLRKVMGRRPLDRRDLQTLLCQIEAIVNSRPLTQASDDPTDFPPLTPSHFLVGESLLKLPSLRESQSTENLQKLWRGRNDTLKAFWKEWRVRYLRQLRVEAKQTSRMSLKVGDVVLIGNEKDRNSWPLAVVEELISGRDGKVRSARVKTATKAFLRPIQHIYPLEQ